MLDFSILTDYLDLYMQGFVNTIKISIIGLIASFILGNIIAVFRLAPVKLLNFIGAFYVEVVRNIPLILIGFFFYNGLSYFHINLSGFIAGTIALSIYTAAFIAEAVRAGIQSVDRGQLEAARSTGLTYIQAMRYIILPQAIKIVIPPIGNQFLNLVKNSSILGVFAGLDLMYYADIIHEKTWITFDTYIFVGMFYLVLTIPLSLLVNYLERRLARSE
ncbi:MULTISPECIES: amino acid ABC transporter permease [Bacillus]|jgi:putative glutamine transport system permease protein|uniref:His/Glu/Gln/Arg/opine family amino ABC transporter, permease, 3-TM region n=1 Tax=Bacillus smithii 7_3_47FAA TaxID=665952 RepID=G9QK39_9BACI|nr:amino acid ABC transporter permease [Bacillus smithii]AKP46397.1 Glutamate transport membrane-spanning protein [Bacillus smithii]EHL78501.1 His/Glu/Gln/Arg/opine family amino ABC transporter, permease, 3-TM region [Bacillus smithii 7_3_47FAA]MED0660715.1 amino acid ABC transporter permease [Bacillus smithii]MED1421535.1 amino acid ABC transporter permease [Bacillus smithii]MED1454774.1 amino acid ABC transporter permease [Bacillus smithii]